MIIPGNERKSFVMVNEDKKYSAKLTGNPLLLHEMRTTARSWLSNEKNTDVVKIEILDKNMFQYKTPKSIPKRLNEIVRRFSILGDSEIELLAKGSVDEAKGICLLAIIKSDKLFFDFFKLIAIENIRSGKKFVDNSDLKNFFYYLREQSDDAKKWTDVTVKKLEAVLKRIMFEARYLKNFKDLDITIPVYSYEFCEALINDGDKYYLELLRGEIGN